jgi:3-methyladenine DNA glycosylase AlkD
MVDRAAPRVVGGHLAGRSKAPLFELAAAAEPLRRRTAITAPLYFVKAGSDEDVAAGFDVAARLADDPEPVVRRAVAIFLKHAGRRQILRR